MQKKIQYAFSMILKLRELQLIAVNYVKIYVYEIVEINKKYFDIKLMKTENYSSLLLNYISNNIEKGNNYYNINSDFVHNSNKKQWHYDHHNHTNNNYYNYRPHTSLNGITIT